MMASNDYTRDFLPEEQVAQRNLATRDAALALGVDEVVPRCSVGAHDGQYGLFMSKAPGLEGCKFAAGWPVADGCLTSKQVRALQPPQPSR